VAKELDRSLPADSPLADDIRLLSEQAERCRAILRTLTTLEAGDAPFDRMQLSHLLEDVVAPHRNFGIAITVTLPTRAEGEPVIARNPGLLYGLGNIVENAVDFAQSQVNVVANWSAEDVTVTITDDGPGFPHELLDRIGAPYVTSRGRNRWRRDVQDEGEESSEGLGLGVFIAKTLLERSGAELGFVNRVPPAHGASVTVRWPRRLIDISGEGEAEDAEAEPDAAM